MRANSLSNFANDENFGVVAATIFGMSTGSIAKIVETALGARPREGITRFGATAKELRGMIVRLQAEMSTLETKIDKNAPRVRRAIHQIKDGGSVSGITLGDLDSLVYDIAGGSQQIEAEVGAFRHDDYSRESLSQLTPENQASLAVMQLLRKAAGENNPRLRTVIPIHDGTGYTVREKFARDVVVMLVSYGFVSDDPQDVNRLWEVVPTSQLQDADTDVDSLYELARALTMPGANAGRITQSMSGSDFRFKLSNELRKVLGHSKHFAAEVPQEIKLRNSDEYSSTFASAATFATISDHHDGTPNNRTIVHVHWGPESERETREGTFALGRGASILRDDNYYPGSFDTDIYTADEIAYLVALQMNAAATRQHETLRRAKPYHQMNGATYTDHYFDDLTNEEIGVDASIAMGLLDRKLKLDGLEAGADFGCGSSLVMAMLMAPWVREVHLIDPSADNRADMNRQLDILKTYFDLEPEQRENYLEENGDARRVVTRWTKAEQQILDRVASFPEYAEKASQFGGMLEKAVRKAVVLSGTVEDPPRDAPPNGYGVILSNFSGGVSTTLTRYEAARYQNEIVNRLAEGGIFGGTETGESEGWPDYDQHDLDTTRGVTEGRRKRHNLFGAINVTAEEWVQPWRALGMDVRYVGTAVDPEEKMRTGYSGMVATMFVKPVGWRIDRSVPPAISLQKTPKTGPDLALSLTQPGRRPGGLSH